MYKNIQKNIDEQIYVKIMRAILHENSQMPQKLVSSSILAGKLNQTSTIAPNLTRLWVAHLSREDGQSHSSSSTRDEKDAGKRVITAKHNSASSSNSSKMNSDKCLELAEYLRQVADFDEVEHQRIMRESENYIQYSIDVVVECDRYDKFLLQFSATNNNDAHNDQQFTVDESAEFSTKLLHGRHSIVRVLLNSNFARPSTQNQCESSRSLSVDNEDDCEADELNLKKQSIPIGYSHLKRRSNSISSIISNSSTSNTSNSSPNSSKHYNSHSLMSRARNNTLNSAHNFSHGNMELKDGYDVDSTSHSSSTNSANASKKSYTRRSSTFLRKWVKSQGHIAPCLTFSIDGLPPNKWHTLPISSFPNAYAKFKLQRTFAESPITPTMDLAEFVKVIRFLKNEEFHHRGAQYGIPAKDFEHLTIFNEEIMRRVAHFYNFSKLTMDLLEISVELDEENCMDSHYVSVTIRRKIYEMEDFVLQDDEKGEITAALFLAERIVNCTETLIKSVPRRMFFPAHRSTVTTTADDTFHRFFAKISPLIDLIYLKIWHYSEVSGLRTSIFQKFSSVLQSSVKEWIHENLTPIISSASANNNSQSTTKMNELCELIDDLRFTISKFGESYETFFERVSISYTGKVIRGVDDLLCVTCRQCLADSLKTLNSRDTEKLLDFTSSSMKLFDAFNELTELTKKFGVECELREFEKWFLEPAIFWSTSWRFVYMDFVRKCIEQATFSEELFRRPSISAPLCQEGHQQRRRRLSTDPKNFTLHSPSPAALSTEDYFFAAMANQRFGDGVQMHESTVNCLAFCKALCDDFVRLRSQNSSILLLGLLQVTAILVDCLGSFVVQLVQQIKQNPNCFRMIEAANGIEHASSYLAKNFEHFLELRRLAELVDGDAERTQALSTVRHMMGSARARCRSIADQIIDGICSQKIDKLRRNCAVITRNYNSINEIIPARIKLETYFRHVFNSNEPADELRGYLDRTCRNLHKILLERLYSTARQTLWRHIHQIIIEQLLQGLSPKYYEEIDMACESICHLLNIEWGEDQSSLRRKLHLNRAETVDLILQYYSELCDLTMTSSMILNDSSRKKISHRVENRISSIFTSHEDNSTQSASLYQRSPSLLRTMTPFTSTSSTRSRASDKKKKCARICLRVGYIRSTNQQILLHIHVLRAYDIPILDTLTQSCDPYVRLELYPRCLFPLSQFPPQNTDTKKQTLNPKWNEIFQILVPEKYFFMNGVCLCITVLDHDIVSYNDLAGQAFLPLSTVSRLDSLSSESMPATPQIIPLAMPAMENRNLQTFQILEQRSQRRDSLAREVVQYEKYLYNYRILPPSALDTKESTLNSLSLAGSRQLISQTLTDLFAFFNTSI